MIISVHKLIPIIFSKIKCFRVWSFY